MTTKSEYTAFGFAVLLLCVALTPLPIWSQTQTVNDVEKRIAVFLATFRIAMLMARLNSLRGKVLAPKLSAGTGS
jgi:hypothetical protein